MRFQFKVKAGRIPLSEQKHASGGANEGRRAFNTVWVGVALIPAIVLASLVLWLVSRRRKNWLQIERYQEDRPGTYPPTGQAKFAVWKEHKPYREEKSLSPKVGADETRSAASKAAAPQPDNLEVIEGIGPQTAAVLREAGITTYQQIANASIDRLNEILLFSGLRLSQPDTWPAQARLAAEGRWDELEALQNQLLAGRTSLE